MSRYGRTGMTSWNSLVMHRRLEITVAAVLNKCCIPARCPDLTGRPAGESTELASHVRLVRVAGRRRDDREGTRGFEQPEPTPKPNQTRYRLRRQPDLGAEPRRKMRT